MAEKQTPSMRLAELQALLVAQFEHAERRGRAREERIKTALSSVGLGRQLRLSEKRAVAAKSYMWRRLAALQRQVANIAGSLRALKFSN